MKPLDLSNQTLSQFIQAPFGVKNEVKRREYEKRYQEYKKKYKIKIEAALDFEGNFFIHLKVPSESQEKKTAYDVVVQFFSPSEKVDMNASVENYYVQFFSNSPGFVYKYATLYRLKGYLIETLQDKFTTGMLEILPDKANKDYELSYDSSIYYACRYLLDNRMGILGKLTMKIFKFKSPERFFAAIQEAESVSTARSLSNIKEQLRREIKSDTDLGNKLAQSKNKNLEKDLTHKKLPSLTTKKEESKLGIRRIKAKESSMSTAKSPRIAVIKRKKPVRSTTKKK